MEGEAYAMTVTDKGLILRVSYGDARAFETLLDLYQKPALRVTQRGIGQQAEAEDMVQEAFLQVHLHAHRYRPETAPFKTWFFSILINICRNAIKRNRFLSFAELPEDATAIDDPESNLVYEEERATLVVAIARLPPNQRLALILRHYKGFSYSEAAAALGISVHALTGIDHSKPIASYVHELLGLPSLCRSCEIKHACYGGIAGLFTASQWTMSGCAGGKKALVIATDIARYGAGTPGESTQGVGAVAMMISDKRALLEFDTGGEGL